MKNAPTALAKLREIKRREDREGGGRLDTDLELSFSFPVVALTRACLRVPSSQFHGGCEAPSWSLPKMGVGIFGRLHIVMATVQLPSLHCRVWFPTNYFPVFFYPAIPQQLFRFNFFQLIGTRRWLVADTFLFSTRGSAAISVKTFPFVSPL